MTHTANISDKEFSNNVFKNFNDLFFNPEIERRKNEKIIHADFQLLAAQVIFFPNGEKPIVRLNEEVKASVKVKKGVDTKVENYWASIKDVERVIFDDAEYHNCGHATMILLTDGYQLSFDFRYNRETCTKHLIVAKEFLMAAEYCYDNKYFSAFIDNSFSSIELLAKCKLIIATNKKMYGKTNHNAIKTEFNRYYNTRPQKFEFEEKSTLKQTIRITK